MKSYLETPTVRRISHRGLRIIRKTIRAVLPFPLRQQVQSLVFGRSRSEISVDGWSFTRPTAYDVVCLPVIEWDFLFQRPQQLLTQFACHGHRNFYIRPEFHQSGATSYLQRFASEIYGVRLPGPRNKSLYRTEIDARTLNDMLSALEALRTRARLTEVVCLAQLPFWTPLALAAKQRWGWKVIYDCMDEHSGFTTNSAAMLETEDELMAGSDLVIATSQILCERASRVSRKALLLPNAADFDHFSRPGNLRPLADLEGPIIGYYGSISYWFDVDMIRKAAVARPKWQFVLIGDTFGSDLSQLKRLSNVHILGKQPYSILPSFLHQFDVACIPFLITPLTRAADPVKFYEYLSAGKPVVAVEIPELEAHRALFYPVRSTEHFVSQVEAALSERSSEAVEARKEFAKRNTWTDRYKVLAEEISRL